MILGSRFGLFTTVIRWVERMQVTFVSFSSLVFLSSLFPIPLCSLIFSAPFVLFNLPSTRFPLYLLCLLPPPPFFVATHIQSLPLPPLTPPFLCSHTFVLANNKLTYFSCCILPTFENTNLETMRERRKAAERLNCSKLV